MAFLSKKILCHVGTSNLWSLGSKCDEMDWGAWVEEACSRKAFSVVDKTTLPPSGDPHDYWHPAPYWWPNPKRRDGIPYIQRDGQRVPGTELYEAGDEKYDRSRLQRLFDDGTMLAIAWRATGEKRYGQHAAAQLIQWFLKPETRMNPHLRYAQIRMTSKRGRRSSAGLIETKDFYYYLDAVRILREGGFLSDAEWAGFRAWLTEFRDWLLGSIQGWFERRKRNNHGLYYDLQLASICAFLDDRKQLDAIFRRAEKRLLKHFEPNGRQPRELIRTMSAHYCTFNLQGWVNLARLAEQYGVDLWNHTARDGRGLKVGLEWLLSFYKTKQWPFQQIKPFDWTRLAPLAAASDLHYGTNHLQEDGYGPFFSLPVCFHPHDGIPPAWQLTLPDDFVRRVSVDNG